MLTLIIILLFGTGVAFFATQNVQQVSVTFANYQLTDIPMYAVVLVSLLTGFFISWIISLAGSISSTLTIHGKNTKIKKSKKDIADLIKQNHQLELENNKLKTELDRAADEKSL